MFTKMLVLPLDTTVFKAPDDLWIHGYSVVGPLEQSSGLHVVHVRLVAMRPRFLRSAEEESLLECPALKLYAGGAANEHRSVTCLSPHRLRKDQEGHLVTSIQQWSFAPDVAFDARNFNFVMHYVEV